MRVDMNWILVDHKLHERLRGLGLYPRLLVGHHCFKSLGFN